MVMTRQFLRYTADMHENLMNFSAVPNAARKI